MATRTGSWFFFLLLATAVVLVAMVVRPIATGLFVAAVLSGVLWPWHERLAKRLRGHRNLSALVWVVAVVILLLGPAVAFSTVAIREGIEGWHFLSATLKSEGVEGLVTRLPDSLERLARFVLDHVPVVQSGDLAEKVGAQGGKAAVAVAATLSATGSLLFQAVMMLIALYFLLLEGDKFVAWLDELLPLAPGQTHELLLEFKRTSFAVIVSTGVTAGVQASAALIGYLIARVPHPMFFAGVTFFVAFIPAVGAGAAGLVAALLLYVTGHTGWAIFLAIWALLVVGLVDNLVKPILIKRGMEMRGVVVFFSLIGGLAAFGSVGLLLGPLVVAFFLALLRMYERDFKAGKPPRHAH
jgi:predicted PurR-regulated permease PerM